MEESRQSKPLIIVIAVVACLALAIAVYFLFFNKGGNQANEPTDITENDESSSTAQLEDPNGVAKIIDENFEAKIEQVADLGELPDVKLFGTQRLYHIVTGEKATVFDRTDGKEFDVSFSYPQFDLDIEGIDEINARIAKEYHDTYDMNFKVSVDGNPEYGIRKDGKNYCTKSTSDATCEFYYLSYDITESDKFLAIYFTKNRYCHCNGDIIHFGYVIDRENKKVLSNEEITKLFNYDGTKIIRDYNSAIDGLACMTSDDKVTSVNNIDLYVRDNKLYYFVVEGCA